MKNITAIILITGVLAVGGAMSMGLARAQGFDDTLDAELDALSAGEENEEPLPSIDDLIDTPQASPSKPATKREEPQPLSATELAPASDEPNADFEKRLAEIYAGHSEPVSSERWSELIGAKAQESYSVQTGDTLWDLSHTLFGDGFYWSKLWAENPEIHNPHRIEKGQALRFIGGSESDAPELHVVDATAANSSSSEFVLGGAGSASQKAEPDKLTIEANKAFDKVDVVPAIKEVPADQAPAAVVAAASGSRVKEERGAHVGESPYFEEDMEGKISQSDLDAGVVIEQSELVPRPQLPPSEVRPKPMSNLPPSFEVYRPRVVDKTVEIKRRASRAEKEVGAIVPGYIAMEKAAEPLGTLEEVDVGGNTASIGQNVFIRANEPLTIGTKVYTVQEKYGVSSSATGKIGLAYEIGGIVEVRELIDEPSRLYRGQVTYAVNPVRVGSQILAGVPPRVPVTPRGRRNASQLTIAAGALAEDRRHFGDESIVFLDRGSVDVQVGDVFAVQARRGERRKTVAPDQLTPIGIIKVFAVYGRVVSAIVVLATEEIRIGDRTGGEFPTRLPDFKVAAPKVVQAPAESVRSE